MPTNTNTNTNANTNTNTHMQTQPESTPLKLEDGRRYLLSNGHKTGILKRYERLTFSGTEVSYIDLLYDVSYFEDGSPINNRHTRCVEVIDDGELPLEIVAGGVYRKRDGSVSGYLAPYRDSTGTYTLKDISNNGTYASSGRFNIDHESDHDLIEALYLPFLRVGMFGRRGDGNLTGCLLVSSYASTPYLFNDPESGITYTPDGVAVIGEENISDIVEIVDKWENLSNHYTLPVCEGLPLRHGDVVEYRSNNHVVTLHSSGYFYIAGCIRVDPDTGSVSQNDFTLPTAVTRIVKHIDNVGLTGDLLQSMSHVDCAGDYKWVNAGKRVKCGYFMPWTYIRESGVVIGVKDSGQRLDGCGGHYLLALPLTSGADPESIEGRRLAASMKALVTYFSHRLSKSESSDTEGDAERQVSDLTIRAEDLISEMFPRERDLSGMNDVIVHVTFDTMTTAMLLVKEGGYFKCKPMTWAKAYTALMKEQGNDVTDEMRRQFMVQFDDRLNDSGVLVEWSTVDETYCTPMEGWNDEDDSVTGSCMEKFCNDDGNGHEVFRVYKKLERADKLRMIKIYIEGDYVGRAICWMPDGANGWVMDRVYCRPERGDFPLRVRQELAKFAVAENILGRTNKCAVKELDCVSLNDITCSGLTGYDYYPYFDTYAGISDTGVHMDNSDCWVVCDCSDGEPTQEELHEAYGRGGYYPESELRWSSYHDAYVHEEDVQSTHDGDPIYSGEAVELGFNSGVYAHEDDAIQVRIPNSNGRMVTVYALEE